MKLTATQRKNIQRQVLIRYNRSISRKEFSRHHFEFKIGHLIASLTGPNHQTRRANLKAMKQIATYVKSNNLKLGAYLKCVCRYVEGQVRLHDK